METRVWLNRSQPQSLYSATMLLYLNAAFGFLFGGLGPLTLLVVAAGWLVFRPFLSLGLVALG